MRKLSRKGAVEELHDLAEKVMRSAVAKVVLTHRRLGLPLAIWRDGKVVEVPPDQLTEHESKARYRVRKSPKG